MCESVEVVRILNVSGALLSSTCRQNSAFANISIMAKLRPPEKSELKLLSLHMEHGMDKRSASSSPTAIKKSSSVDSLSSCSDSSSIDDSDKFAEGKDKMFDELDNIIDGVKKINIFNDTSNGYQAGSVVDSDDENSDKQSEEEEEEEEEDELERGEEGLIERGPVRPQFHPMHARASPYIETFHVRSSTGLSLQNENSTDFDTSAKEILTDNEYRQKIDFCLDKLSDMSQEFANSLSPADSDFGSASAYSPPQQSSQQVWQPDRSPTGSSSSCLVPSITVSDSESSLLEILSRGGFQSARTPEHAASLACASDACPDSPASSYNALAASSSVSRPDSRASSRAQSPGSISSSAYGSTCGPSFLNVLGSPTGSPQVSPLSYRHYPRPSSSSSSGQSYCDTPSPANYQNPLDQHLEEQLGEHVMTRLPAWRERFESSETLVNSSVDSSELQLQLVDEVIRGEMAGGQPRHQDIQVVPNCQANGYQLAVGPQNPARISPLAASGCLAGNDGHDDTDDLTSTLLRFVGSEQPIGTTKRLDASPNSCATSGYGSPASAEIKRDDGSCRQIEHLGTNNFLGARGSIAQQHNHQTMYQQQQQPQHLNINAPIQAKNMQFPTASVDVAQRNSWQGYAEANAMLQKLSPSNCHFNDFQIPETVASYNSQRSNSSSKCSSRRSSGNGMRSIAPWPSLNLPSTRASERLKEMTEPKAVEKAMLDLLKRPLDQLAKGDKDGDTMLMLLVSNPSQLKPKLAYLAPLVERLGAIDGALSALNYHGEDALYLAAMNCPQMAFATGYLAAAFLQKNIDIGQRLYRSRGDTLVHALAAKGDAYGEVLAELLSLKTPQQNAVFNLSKRNYDGRTALHVAAEAHDSMGRNSKTVSIGMVRLLLENGADPTIREDRCGDTALHIAVSLSCDPSLVKALLMGRGREAVNITNYSGNTPLHLAATIADRTSLERQSEICWHLVQAGGRSNITNRQGKTPLALVAADRKEPLRRIFHKKT